MHVPDTSSCYFMAHDCRFKRELSHSFALLRGDDRVNFSNKIRNSTEATLNGVCEALKLSVTVGKCVKASRGHD